MKIIGYEQSDNESIVTSIDMWYDRHSRNWVIQRKDNEGNQIGTADYVYTKLEAQTIKEQYQSEYNLWGINNERKNLSIMDIDRMQKLQN